ncbi:hypothetical protein R2103_13675 [Nitrosomonas sp. Is24]|uniref:hypothetical protein n=1 Tax=Nitrosomonas sp. Is24 TaxID=3080533 RepID=UPI00294B7D4D|nr:hypothetical protein [Nitrosomonas sp. Is24]MDV6342819.1 hypothetical protein [Nitrosomonas sp. Is24]
MLNHNTELGYGTKILQSLRKFSSNTPFHTLKRRRQLLRLRTLGLRHVRLFIAFATNWLRDAVDLFSGFDFVVLTVPSRKH